MRTEVRAAGDRVAELGIIPTRPVGVGLEQDHRPSQLLGLARFLRDGCFVNRPFLVREPHDIPLAHGNLRVDADGPQNRRSWQPENSTWTGH